MKICLICNNYFKRISNTHLKKHNLTAIEYFSLFPKLCVCVCGEKVSSYSKRFIIGHHMKMAEYRKNMSEFVSKRTGKLNSFYGKRHKESSIETIRLKNRQNFRGTKNPFYGKHHTTETRENLKQKSIEYYQKNGGMSEAHRKAISKGLIGNTNSLGYKHNDEFRENAKNRAIKMIKEGKFGQKLGLPCIFSSKGRRRHREASQHQIWSEGRREKARQKAIHQLEVGTFGYGMSGHHLRESRPEQLYREFLESLGAIKGVDFEQEYHVGTYWLDFAFPSEMKYLEIDGRQHLEPKAKQHDQKRDLWLDQQGWEGMRLTTEELIDVLKSFGFFKKGK